MRARQPQRPADHQRKQQRGSGGGRGNGHGIAQCRQQLRRSALAAQPFERLHQQVQRRGEEPGQHRQRADHQCQRRARAVQPLWLHRARALGGGIALMTACMALQRHQGQHDHQHGQRDLCRAGQIRAGHPGGIDRHGQGLHAEELRGPDVVEGFQQHQHHADGNGRTGQRQGNPEKHRHRAGAQAAPGFKQAGGLGHEQGAGGQVDIRIQHQRQQHDAAGQMADVRQTEITRTFVPQQPAQRALHRAQRVQQIQIGVGNDIGRHRQWQQQGPAQDTAPGKRIGGDQPGAAGTGHRHQHADAEQDNHGIGAGPGQHRGQQVRPQPRAAIQRDPAQGQHRGQHQRGDDQCCQQPARRSIRQAHRLLPARVDADRWGRDRAGMRTLSYRNRPCPPARWPACGWPPPGPAAADQSSSHRSWPPPDPAPRQA